MSEEATIVEDDHDDTTTTGTHEVPRIARDTAKARAITSSARLVCVAGPDLGKAIPIGPGTIVLGRGSAATFNVQAADVSRRHAQVRWGEDGFVVEDLGSSNGTFVNGAKVAGAAVPISTGDRLQLGDTTIFVLAHHDELEARMRQLQKLDAMEQAVGGVAHDFNNALTVITAAIDYALLLASSPAEIARVLGEAQKAAASASALARQLQQLARRRSDDQAPLVPVLLAPLVDDTVAMARRLFAAPIEVTVEVEPALHVRGARDELGQVLLNLIINARDAMPDGGKLTIGARTVGMPHADVLAHLTGPGPYVELAVADTGVGMDEATLARAFEPFFTTKEPGHGTGLGLAMVHNIVRRHGGEIQVDSTVGKGTRFRIWLPSAA